MAYELWNTERRNVIGTYDTESDALAVVRDAAATYGSPYLTTMALVIEDVDGEIRTLTVGDTLRARAGVQAA